MPITKRMAHYGSPKDLLAYILDEKHSGKKIGEISSINCNVETALLEFNDLQNRFKAKGNRVAYHIIQSFSPLDKITVEQANEIGKKLCEELYSDYQCVISTHIDRGHIHNHIYVSAVNINGKKLEDRLSNEKEGLYGLSNTSDRIASQYGCFILPKKIYVVNKKKDYYHQYKEQTYREKIETDLEKLISNKCNSLEELLDELSILGYSIKRGKHIAVKSINMKKFARIDTINSKYSNSNLYNYFKNISKVKLLGIKSTETEFNGILLQNAKESKTAIEKSELQATGKTYNEYQKTKYQEIKRYYNLKQQLEYLDKYNIHSFDDIENEIESKRKKIKTLNVDLKKNKEQYDIILQRTEKAQDYIRLSKVYEYVMSYKMVDSNYILPKEVEIFLALQKELNINSVDDAKNLINNSRKERIKINQLKKQVLELQRELNQLDTIKEEKLSNSDLFIHNIKFGGNRIDYELSNDEKFCISLPYTHEKIYIDKRYTAFNNKYQYYTLYLVDDKEYEIYSEDNELIGTITGTELEKYVLDKKKEIDMMYS